MSKYIMSAFHEQYPRDSPDREFPHDSTAITKGHLTAKIKNIRGKYRQAVDSGRRSGHGRVVLMFFELCEEIWGGSPATRSIEQGIETADLVETSSSTSELPTDSPQSSDFVESLLPPPVVRQRREMLQAKLNSHRGDRLKRKVPADTGQEELQLKRRMLDLMEESSVASCSVKGSQTYLGPRWMEIVLQICLTMTDTAWRDTPKAFAVFRSLPSSLK
uniref:Uncharacterized protein n=1 Tax=Knipowitschia caucasica TaxID=637954 RepID=A0AAV2LQT0_KNICA